MFVQFLVEDASGKELLTAIMEKYNTEIADQVVEYDIRPYKGIGNLSNQLSPDQAISQQLLVDLPKRLKAFDIAFRGRSDAAVFIVLDLDDNKMEDMRSEFSAMVMRRQITVDHVFCFAVEEMEAWLLGDCDALQTAYPQLSDRIASKHANYSQDSICNTWEFLADILTRKGLTQFRKDHPTAYDVGRCKLEWARKIGVQLTIRTNESPSFQQFLEELDARYRV